MKLSVKELYNFMFLRSKIYFHAFLFLYSVLASDEPGGNRNRSIKINAQHNVRKRAIQTIIYIDIKFI